MWNSLYLLCRILSSVSCSRIATPRLNQPEIVSKPLQPQSQYPSRPKQPLRGESTYRKESTVLPHLDNPGLLKVFCTKDPQPQGLEQARIQSRCWSRSSPKTTKWNRTGFVLPVFETCVDFIGVLVERSGEEAVLLGGYSSGETLDAYANMHSSSDLTRLCRELFVNLLFE